MIAAVSLIYGGVLERFPGLQVAFLEAGCGWVPVWLHRMDEHWENSTDRDDRRREPDLRRRARAVPGAPGRVPRGRVRMGAVLAPPHGRALGELDRAR